MPKVLGDIDLIDLDNDLASYTYEEAAEDRDKARQLVKDGRRLPSKWRNAAIQRQFISWDGEGITPPGPGSIPQDYVLFGASTGDRIKCEAGISSAECFDLILDVERRYPEAIHIGFGLQYDINMFLKDLSKRHLWRLYRNGRCRWNGYKLEYRPRKWLTIRKSGTTARLYDVFGFFQSSFVKACEQFLGADDPELVRIREGKAERPYFTYDEMDEFIVPYWEAELRMMVRLMDSLRNDFNRAELRVSSWHGPGAVANAVFKTHKTKQAMAETPKEVNRASQYAYAGGRFELFQVGHWPGPVWQYDINSAYPAAIAELPNLCEGTWRYTDKFESGTFGVWEISYYDPAYGKRAFMGKHPLFHRDKNANISYPAKVDGWYWTPEAAITPESVIGGWVFDHSGEKPFAFVKEMYETRKQWKKDGNSAERALKLALNSLYGKMAQRIGFQVTENGGLVPAFHQLEWAGYVTSVTRAKLWEAMNTDPDSVIALETDALFTTKPLPGLDMGTGLGQWEPTEYEWMTWVQSGFYFGRSDGRNIAKYRGLDKGSVTHEMVMEYLRAHDNAFEYKKLRPIKGTTHRFVGMGIALHTSAVWRSWETVDRVIRLGGDGKRTHHPVPCPSCSDRYERRKPLISTLHPTVHMDRNRGGSASYPHKLPWVDLATYEPWPGDVADRITRF